MAKKVKEVVITAPAAAKRPMTDAQKAALEAGRKKRAENKANASAASAAAEKSNSETSTSSPNPPSSGAVAKAAKAPRWSLFEGW